MGANGPAAVVTTLVSTQRHRDVAPVGAPQEELSTKKLDWPRVNGPWACVCSTSLRRRFVSAPGSRGCRSG